MGRAHEVRKKAMAATAAAKTKVYSKFGKEIYIAAKAGVPDPDMNVALKRIIEKAKKAQVPADIIKRAVDKAKSGASENYTAVTYEGFGPGASTFIIECLTDNVNRTVASVKSYFTKCHSKIGVSGCVAHLYNHTALIGVKGSSADELLEILMMAGVEVNDIEEEDDLVTVYGEPNQLYEIKTALEEGKPGIDIEVEEITWIAPDYITLEGDDLMLFERLMGMLEEDDDVQDVYHNVNA